jgi:hypothetical protein
MFSVFRVRQHRRGAHGSGRASTSGRLLSWILLLLFVAGCSRGASTATGVADTPAPQETQAPTVVPSETATSAPTAVLDSTPSPGKGNAIGLMIRAPRGVQPHPMQSTKLYLAEMLRNAQGDLAGLAGVDEERAPFAWTDAEGRFAFADIEPGHYALVIKHPLTLALAHDEPSGRDVVVEVIAGQIQDLGTIQVDLTE